jgi:L-amino acid N-acyltransferase
MIETRRIIREEYDMHVERLAEILKDCVDGGASVNFVLPFSIGKARDYWNARRSGLDAREVRLFGSFIDDELVGTVQLVLARQPNGLHRAEISKMLVHRKARRMGLGRSRRSRSAPPGPDVAAARYGTGQPGRKTLPRLRLEGIWCGGWLCTQCLGQTGTGGFFQQGAVMTVPIFHCRETDLVGIAAIYNHAVQHSNAIWNDALVDVANRRVWWQERALGGFPVLVARESDDVLGYGSFGPFRPFAGYRSSVEHSVYVREDQRGRGIGKAMLRALQAEARQGGFHAMVGGIAHDNAPSIALHAAEGFVEVGRMPEIATKFDTWQTLVLMQKLLA